MRLRWPLTTWLILLLAAAALLWLGGRWVISQAYPLTYRVMIFQRAQEAGLDPYLVAAVIRNESKFRAEATSHQGARGLMQIMPETGEWVAGQMRIPFREDLLFDPDYNIRLGSWYLASLKKEFAGDVVLALAAYNGGRNNVHKWLKEQQWTGEPSTLDQIPFQETRVYVARVLRDHDRYRRIYTANP